MINIKSYTQFNECNMSWTKNKVNDIAKKYEYEYKFRWNDELAYLAAYRNGWLDDVCSHMFKK